MLFSVNFGSQAGLALLLAPLPELGLGAQSELGALPPKVKAARSGRPDKDKPVSGHGELDRIEVALLGLAPNLVRIGALVVEALVGDRAIVKLEAYPFTRYGTLSGEVAQVSPDAIVDEKRGGVFPMRVRLSQTHLTVDGRQALLSVGLSASVEIVTGKRRVIEFVWSPVAKTVSEAGRER